MGFGMAEEGRSSADDGVAAAVYSERTSLRSGVDGYLDEVRSPRKGI